MNIVVAGATGEIGAALVRELKQGGHHIYTVSHTNPLTDARCDITDASAVQEVVANMTKGDFEPECVIIASGVFENDLIPQYDRALLDKNMAVNFFGALNIIDAMLPYFLSRGKGHVIALSSIAAFRPNKRGVGYPASKAALALLMRGFDLAFRPQGIAFSVAYLGPTRTSMWEGGDSLLVASPERIARSLSRLVESRKTEAYMPFLSTTLARLALLLPDRVYMLARRILLA